MLSSVMTLKDYAAWDVEFWTRDPESGMYMDSTYVTLLLPREATFKDASHAADECFKQHLIRAAEDGLKHEITFDKKPGMETYEVYK